MIILLYFHDDDDVDDDDDDDDDDNNDCDVDDDDDVKENVDNDDNTSFTFRHPLPPWIVDACHALYQVVGTRLQVHLCSVYSPLDPSLVVVVEIVVV